jgi:hypothetical protein
MANRYSVLFEDDTKPLGVSLDNQKVRKSASPQADIPANPQGALRTNTQVRKPAKPQAVFSRQAERERYSTRLLPETIKAIKLYAVQHELNDYEVVEKALEQLLENQDSKSPQTR